MYTARFIVSLCTFCLIGFVAAGEDGKVLDKEAVFCWLGLWQWAAGLHPDKWTCKLHTHTHTNTHCANRHFPVNMEIFGHILTSKLPGGACIMYSFCYLTF